MAIGKVVDSLEPIDIVLNVKDSASASEYFFSEGVTNNSGAEIVAYRFELGFGTGANFVASTVADRIDFDTPQRDPPPTSGLFSNLSHSDEIILWTGGVIPVGGPEAFTFSIDVPNFQPGGTPDSAIIPGGYQFTLRQISSVIPEPSAFSLGVLAALSIGWRRLRMIAQVDPKLSS